MALIMLIVMNLAVMASLYIFMFILSAFFGISFDNGTVSGIFMMALIFGFGGAFVSLFMSKWMAKKSMGVQIIETPRSSTERWLLATIEHLSNKAGIKMPEVGIFEGAPNAFATGWDKNDALVAVSTGLLDMMDEAEVEGVLAHEISHVKNGDMITMTLMQGVLNTFVIFISRILADILAKDRDGNTNQLTYFGISMALEMVFSIFSTMILMWFSRYREYKADEGAVMLSGPNGIYYALAKLGQVPAEQLSLNGDMKAFGIVGFLETYFASHPPIEKRLQHIKEFVN